MFIVGRNRYARLTYPIAARATLGSRGTGSDRVLESSDFLDSGNNFFLLPRQDNVNNNPVNVTVPSGRFTQGDFLRVRWNVPFFYDPSAAALPSLAQVRLLCVYTVDGGTVHRGIQETLLEMKLQAEIASVEEPEKYIDHIGEIVFQPIAGAAPPQVRLACGVTVDAGDGQNVQMIPDANSRPGFLFVEVIPASAVIVNPALSDVDVSGILINPTFVP